MAGGTHYNKIVSVTGTFVGPASAEVQVSDGTGNLYQLGTKVDATATEINKLHDVTAGTASASKAAVLGTNKNLDVLAIADLKLGAGAGTSVTATAAEINTLASVSAGTATASKAAVLGTNKNLDTLVIADGGFKLGSGAGTAVTATAAELNTLDLSTVGAGVKCKILPVTRVASTAEQDTGWALPAKAVVLDVLLDITTAESTGGTKQVTVGTLASGGGDADGYIVAGNVTSTELVRGKATLTTGSNETYFASTTRGALLATLVAGSDVAGDVGTYYEFPDITMGGKKISYSLGSNDFAELVANIVVIYTEIV